MLQRILDAVGRGNIGFALHVIARHVDFMRGQRIDQVIHAQDRVRRVFALREARDQFLERIKRVARRLGIALGQILSAEKTHDAEVFVEINQPAQVMHVIGAGMIGMHFDKTVDGSLRGSRVLVLPVGIGHFDLRLLRKPAEGVARFELFKELDRLVPVAGARLRFGLGVHLLHRPALGLVVIIAAEQAAGAEQPAAGKRGDYR